MGVQFKQRRLIFARMREMTESGVSITCPFTFSFLGPGNGLNRLLQIVLRALNIQFGRVERVMSHDLRQAVQRDGLSHPIAKAVPQIVGTDIREPGGCRIFFDDIAQGTF